MIYKCCHVEFCCHRAQLIKIFVFVTKFIVHFTVSSTLLLWLRFWRIMCFPSLIIELIWWLGHHPFDEFHEHVQFWFIILLSDTDTARRFWHACWFFDPRVTEDWDDSSLNINYKLKLFVNKCLSICARTTGAIMRVANIKGGVFPQDLQRFYLKLEVPTWSII